MHFVSNLLAAREAIAWASISPTCLRGDLYNDREEKIAENVDMVLTSEKVGSCGDSMFNLLGIDIYAKETEFSLNNTDRGILYLGPTC